MGAQTVIIASESLVLESLILESLIVESPIAESLGAVLAMLQSNSMTAGFGDGSIHGIQGFSDSRFKDLRISDAKDWRFNDYGFRISD
jgi:hypothetical protein